MGAGRLVEARQPCKTAQSHPNRTLTHRELLRAVWGADYGDEVEYLRVFVSRLRWKIEPDRDKPRFLVTDAWVGYRFCLPK